MDDELLVRIFEAGAVPETGFGHVEHVRVAWWYLRRSSLADAISRFSIALKRFAAARSKPNLYHETVTVAYLLIINQRLETVGREAPWELFASRNADLLTWRPSLLDRYYTPEALWSDRARKTFIMPDRLSS